MDTVSATDAPDNQAQPSAENPTPFEVVENSIGMKLVLIPAGEFEMGTRLGKTGTKTEETQHHVRLTKGFWMGQTEVTQAQYQAVMATNPSWFSRDGEGKDEVIELDTSHFPVERVSWDDAQEFCRKLSALAAEQSAGREYRLPTEAEWEYACRSGTQMEFAFGDSLSSTQANFNKDWPDDSAGPGMNLPRPVTVGSYKANAFGLFDMHGNVWEWCEDYSRDYDDVTEVSNDVDYEVNRVIRGGSWNTGAYHCRSVSREVTAHTSWSEVDRRRAVTGFRVSSHVPPQRRRP